MLKLLNKKSNTVFVLPDDRAIDMYKKDKETFEILDGGFVEEEAPRQATVQELVMGTKEKVEEDEQEETQVQENKTDINKMSLFELRVLGNRLGIKYSSKMTKAQLIKLINEKDSK